ncbi:MULTISPECIES: DUF7520 family protein [Natrialbaceae]|uniref:DUF7520 family protein n=1 Tax=Natrialbaceae TaxID=1644061 RepID=UPI00207C7365|nr:hypothetical protein [Natronococcus sp. CG52]
MTTDADRNAGRTLEGRRIVLTLGLALVLATAVFGALLGYALPVQSGLEEVTVLGITFVVSPATFALYGGVSVGTFLATLLFVVRGVSRFDEHALE